MPSARASSNHAAAPATAPATEPTAEPTAIDQAIDEMQGLASDLRETMVAIEQAQAAPKPETFDFKNPRVIEPVTVTLGGRERALRMPFKSIRAFQKQTGLSIWDHARVWRFPPDYDTFVALLWAALLHEQPDLTLEEVEALDGLEFGQIHYLMAKLDEMWGRNAQPSEDAPASENREGEAPNHAAAPTTG
jgi:hypothetical protein